MVYTAKDQRDGGLAMRPATISSRGPCRHVEFLPSKSHRDAPEKTASGLMGLRSFLGPEGDQWCGTSRAWTPLPHPIFLPPRRYLVRRPLLPKPRRTDTTLLSRRGRYWGKAVCIFFEAAAKPRCSAWECCRGFGDSSFRAGVQRNILFLDFRVILVLLKFSVCDFDFD